MVELAIERIRKLVSGLNVTELNELIELAQEEKAGKIEEAKQALIAETQEKAAALGLTTADLFGGVRDGSDAKSQPKSGRAKQVRSEGLPAKYRSPEGDTWSGRGRKPKWIAMAEAEGKDIGGFRIS